jgi:hypothetical protein
VNIFLKIKNKNRQHPTFWGVVVLFMLVTPNLYAQKGFSLTAGWGKYELTNIGVQWNCSSNYSLSAFAGSNFGLNNNTSWSAGMSFNHVFRKPENWIVKPGYSLGTVFWTYNDDLYLFKTMSFPLMALLEYPVTSFLKVRAEGGIIFSAVMQSDRKQNVTAGYPKRVDGNFAIKLIYKFNRNEQ